MDSYRLHLLIRKAMELGIPEYQFDILMTRHEGYPEVLEQALHSLFYRTAQDSDQLS